VVERAEGNASVDVRTLPPDVVPPRVAPASVPVPGGTEPEGWRDRRLDFSANTGPDLAGAVLLDALARHAYVRVEDDAMLDELRRLVIPGFGSEPLPLEAGAEVLRTQGYEARLRYPGVFISRLEPDDAER
jgi:hypothetical protein